MYTYLFIYFCICICVFMHMCMHTLYTYVYIRILHRYEIMYVYDRNWTFPQNTFVVILIANAMNLRIHLRELQFILFYFYHPRKYFAIQLLTYPHIRFYDFLHGNPLCFLLNSFLISQDLSSQSEYPQDCFQMLITRRKWIYCHLTNFMHLFQLFYTLWFSKNTIKSQQRIISIKSWHIIIFSSVFIKSFLVLLHFLEPLI